MQIIGPCAMALRQRGLQIKVKLLLDMSVMQKLNGHDVRSLSIIKDSSLSPSLFGHYLQVDNLFT